MEVVFDWWLFDSFDERHQYNSCMFFYELSMLLWLVFCSEIMLALEERCGDSWCSSKENEHMEVLWVMLPLDVFQCAGDIHKSNANTMNACLEHG